MGHITGLKCKECGKTWPKEPTAACAECWGPLEADYDLDAVRRTFTRDAIAGRPRDLWRYAELLPLDGEPTVGRGTGFTPLLAAPASVPPSASATSGSNTTPPVIPRSRSRTAWSRSRSARRRSSASTPSAAPPPGTSPTPWPRARPRPACARSCWFPWTSRRPS